MTAKDVAEWMASKIESHGQLYHEQAAWDIAIEFGRQFTFENQNGSPSIAREVLCEFRKLTAASVVWESGEKLWRKRLSTDIASRRQY
jgi:hypothetical protein